MKDKTLAVFFGISLATSVNAQVKTKIQELCITPQSTIRNFFKAMSGPSGQSVAGLRKMWSEILDLNNSNKVSENVTPKRLNCGT